MTFRVLDLTQPEQPDRQEVLPGVVVAYGDSIASGNDRRLEHASFALTETEVDDVRWIQVPSVPAALEELEDRFARWSQAAAVCDDVLRTAGRGTRTLSGVITESLAYSTLQAGPEFKRWLAGRGRAEYDQSVDPVLIERSGDRLEIQLNRPRKHNAFSNNMRAALLEALEVAAADNSIDKVVLSGAGPSFCSGGDLAEFGTFTDPVSAHLARTRHSPALALDSLAHRLKRNCQARIHGQVLGSGLEMAAFCGRVVCSPDAVLGLPELRLGLIPGAGGTVSVTRRIGRWRTAYLVLMGRTIDAATALRWGLVDVVETEDGCASATMRG